MSDQKTEQKQQVNTMTDLVQKLVGALEGMLALDEEDHQRYPGDEDVCKEVRDARAALSEAKAGGWVAVPVEPTEAMVVAFAEEWYSHAQTIDDPQMTEAYKAMLAARPLPDPPAQRGKGD